MTIFLCGGGKSGKSSMAQELAVKLNSDKHYYVATMIPTDGEDRRRIRLHLVDRAGMGFETIECGRGILNVLKSADRSGSFLLDSVTALLMNELFDPARDYALDETAGERICRELLEFVDSVQHAVIVSDYIFADPIQYDPATERYREDLAAISRALAAACDTVLEVTAGAVTIHKGELPA